MLVSGALRLSDAKIVISGDFGKWSDCDVWRLCVGLWWCVVIGYAERVDSQG